MERLHSLFVSLYLPLLIVLGALALRQLSPAQPGWYGAALACLALPAWLALLQLRHPPRERAHLPVVTLIIWIGSCLAVWGTVLDDNPGWQPMLWAVLAAGGYLVFLLWPVARPSIAQPAQPGTAVLPLPLSVAEGVPVAEALEKRAALWLFFRGNWSPLCRGQVAELMRLRPALADRRAQLVLVSPQPAARTRALLGPEADGVLVCEDRELAASRRLGLVRPGAVPLWWRLLGHGTDTIQPALMLTDAEGDLLRLAISDNDYARPSPVELLRLLGRNEGRGAEGGRAASPAHGAEPRKQADG